MALDLGGLRLCEHDRLSAGVTVKRFGDRFKLTYHKHGLLRSGLDRQAPAPAPSAGQDEGRFASSISRTRAAVFELAACNPWDYFCTFTLADDHGFDRFDLAAWHADFAQWVRNQRRLRRCDLRYLIVPEAHKNGAWHMHGLFMGFDAAAMLRPFEASEKLPYAILDKLRAGQPVFDWPAYRRKYGFVTVEPVRELARAAGYIAKYVTKAFLEPSLAANAHMYFASHGLARAELIACGSMHVDADFQWDFENDHIAICWADSPHWLEVIDLMV